MVEWIIGFVAVCVGNFQRENRPETASLKRTFPPVIGINSSARSGRFLGSLLASWESAHVKNPLGTESNTCVQKHVSSEYLHSEACKFGCLAPYPACPSCYSCAHPLCCILACNPATLACLCSSLSSLFLGSLWPHAWGMMPPTLC